MVMIHKMEKDQADSKVKQMKAEGFDVAAYPCDVVDYTSCEAAVSQIKDLGTVDILVNNAGITRDSMFKKNGQR